MRLNQTSSPENEANINIGRRRIHRLAPVRETAGGRERHHLSRQLFHRSQKQYPAPAAAPQFRGDPPRHHLPLHGRGRGDLQPRLSRFTDLLPARSDQNHPDVGDRLDQHAGHGQIQPGENPPGLDLGGLRRPADPPPPSARITGATSTRWASARATTRANAAPSRSL